MSDENMTYGKFVTKKTTRPVIEVDCSTWADPSVTNWTYGKFVTKKSGRPAVEVRLTVPHLRLKVSFQPGVSLETLEATTRAMVVALHAAAPDLNLQYDPTLSGLEKDSHGIWVAVLGLSGGPFPPGTFEHVRSLLAALYDSVEPPPKVKKVQELKRIKTVVVRSALELCDEDMAEAEAAFQLEEAAIQTTGGMMPEQSQKVADALDGLRCVVEAARCDGIRFVLGRDDDSA